MPITIQLVAVTVKAPFLNVFVTPVVEPASKLRVVPTGTVTVPPSAKVITQSAVDTQWTEKVLNLCANILAVRAPDTAKGETIFIILAGFSFIVVIFNTFCNYLYTYNIQKIMKTHNFKFLAFPSDGTILLGLQYAAVDLEDEDTAFTLEGHMITIGLFFFKIVYIYVKF